MSDEIPGAAPAAAPDIPVETPPVQPAEPGQEPGAQERVTAQPGPLPKQAARTALHENVRRFEAQRTGAEATPGPEATDAKGNLHRPSGTPEGGEFAPKGDQPTDPGAEKDAAAAAPTDVAAAAATQVADGHVRIELEDGHPIRDQGLTHVDVPEGLERVFRAAMNNPARRSEVDQARAAVRQAQTETADMRRHVARVNAETDLIRSGGLAKLSDPKLEEMLAQAEEHDPERAQVLREALEANRNELIRQKGDEAERDVQDEEVGREFLAGLQAEGPEHYSVWRENGVYRERIARMVGQYGDEVDRRMANGGAGPSLKEFFGHVDSHYVRDPDVQAKVVQYREQQEQKIRDEAAQDGRRARDVELEQERREAAARHGRRPPTASAHTHVPGTSIEDGADPVQDAKPGQRHKVARGLAREIGESFRR